MKKFEGKKDPQIHLKKKKIKKIKIPFPRCTKALVNTVICNNRLSRVILDLFPCLKSLSQILLERKKKTEAEKPIQHSALHPALTDKIPLYVADGPTHQPCRSQCHRRWKAAPCFQSAKTGFPSLLIKLESVSSQWL